MRDRNPRGGGHGAERRDAGRSSLHALVIAASTSTGLVFGDEDAHVARDPRHRRQGAADADGEALAALVEDADESDAVDLRCVAAVRAGGDRVLVLPRQVAELRVAVEEARRVLDHLGAIEELIGVEALDGTAGDVADRVAAAAGGGEPRRVEVAEDIRERA